MLDTDVVELLESGCSLIVGTVDDQTQPEAARGWGLQVLGDGTSLRVLVAADAEVTLANVARAALVAVTGTSVATFRSIQAKGRALVVEPATGDDQQRHDRYFDAFTTAVHETEGTALELLRRMQPSAVVVFTMTVEDLYDQTPGPTAGQRLTAGTT